MSNEERAKMIAAVKATIAVCDKWIASLEKQMIGETAESIKFLVNRRDSWVTMKAQSEKNLAKLEAV